MASTALNYVLQTSESTFTEIGTSPSTKVSISGASLEANTSYLLIVYAQVGSNDNNSNQARARIEFEGAILASSDRRTEPSIVNTDAGHKFWVVKKVTTDASPANINFQIWSNDGIVTAHVNRTLMLAIKVDDTDTDLDALHSGDYAYSDTETTLDITVANQWEDGESITVGNGSDDYVVFWQGATGGGPGSTAMHMSRLDDGTTQYMSDENGRGDSNDDIHIGGMVYLAAPSASTTLTAQFTSTSTAGDVDENSILAIRLNRFEDYAGVFDTASHPTSIAAADTDYLGATLTHTTVHEGDVARDWIFFGGMNVTANETGKRFSTFLDQAGTVFGGDHDRPWQNDYGASSVRNLFHMELKNLADNVDTDVDVGCQEESDVTPASTIDEGTIVGFTAFLAAPGGEVINRVLTSSVLVTDPVDNYVFTKRRPGERIELFTEALFVYYTYARLVAENFSLTDQIILEQNLQRQLLSAATVEDAVELMAQYFRQLSESISLTDNIRKTITVPGEVDNFVTVQDQLGVQDSIFAQFIGITQSTQFDSIAIDAAIVIDRFRARSPLEQVAIIEDLINIIQIKRYHDSIPVTDTFTAIRPPVERLRTLTDTFNVRDFVDIESGTTLGPSVEVDHGIENQ